MYPQSRAINIHNLARYPPLGTRNPPTPLGPPLRKFPCNIENKGHHRAFPNDARNRERARDLWHHRGLFDSQLAHVGLTAHTYATFAENDMHSCRAFGDIAGRHTNSGRHVVIAVNSNGAAPTCTRSTFGSGILPSTRTPPLTRLRELVAGP